MKALLDLDLYIGVTAFNIRTFNSTQIAVEVPMDRLLLGTNAPYNDIIHNTGTLQHIRTFFRQTDKTRYNPEKHTEWIVEERNEPCKLVQLVEVLAAVRVVPLDEVITSTYENSLKLLGLKERDPRDIKRQADGQ